MGHQPKNSKVAESLYQVFKLALSKEKGKSCKVAESFYQVFKVVCSNYHEYITKDKVVK